MQLLKKSVHFGLRSESPDLSFPGGGLGGVLALGSAKMHVFARFFFCMLFVQKRTPLQREHGFRTQISRTAQKRNGIKAYIHNVIEFSISWSLVLVG